VKKGDEEFEEKKVGPIVVRTNTKKKKSVPDAENPAETIATGPEGGDAENTKNTKIELADAENPSSEPTGVSKTPV